MNLRVAAFAALVLFASPALADIPAPAPAPQVYKSVSPNR